MAMFIRNHPTGTIVEDHPKPPIETILAHYGYDDYIPDYGWRNILCPFHDDRTKSAVVNIEEQAFSCFACSVSGDVYSVVMSAEGVSFPDAKRIAEKIAGESDSNIREESRSGRFLSHSARNQQRDGTAGSTWSRHRT